MPESAAAERVYIHEFVDIRDHHRAAYVHHVAANWSPHGQSHRNQLCFGVWSVVGSTGRWPQVVNLWEEAGWAGLAASFEQETVGAGAQDPALAQWWAEAVAFRRGGFDRIMTPARWSPGIVELQDSDAVGAAVYAHEMVRLDGGGATAFLEAARVDGAAAFNAVGWQLIAGFSTAMSDDDEALLLWAVPTWARWGDGEAAHRDPTSAVSRWRSSLRPGVQSWHRIALVNAPLSPLRIGRQPAASDWD